MSTLQDKRCLDPVSDYLAKSDPKTLETFSKVNKSTHSESINSARGIVDPILQFLKTVPGMHQNQVTLVQKIKLSNYPIILPRIYSVITQHFPLRELNLLGVFLALFGERSKPLYQHLFADLRSNLKNKRQCAYHFVNTVFSQNQTALKAFYQKAKEHLKTAPLRNRIALFANIHSGKITKYGTLVGRGLIGMTTAIALIKVMNSFHLSSLVPSASSGEAESAFFALTLLLGDYIGKSLSHWALIKIITALS